MSTREGKTLKEQLARYIDFEAFQPIEPSVKFTCVAQSKRIHDEKKARRERALKTASAAIRFLLKPGPASALAHLQAKATEEQAA